MSTQKMLRIIREHLRAEGLQSSVENDRTAHPKLLVTHKSGHVQRISVPSSPRCEEHAIRHVLKAVRRHSAGEVGHA